MTVYLATVNEQLIQIGTGPGPLGGYVRSSTLTRIEAMTQAEYDLIPVPSPQTVYVILP